jgi:hypothetical protein
MDITNVWKNMPFEQKAEILVTITALGQSIAFITPNYWFNNWEELPKNLRNVLVMFIHSPQNMEAN